MLSSPMINTRSDYDDMEDPLAFVACPVEGQGVSPRDSTDQVTITSSSPTPNVKKFNEAQHIQMKPDHTAIDDMSKNPIENNVDITENKEKEPERPQWDNQIEFVLSSIGYAVGLGNVWRFPYIAYTNGGGSFLIPYLIMLLFAGLPLFFMESALGQYCGQGPTKVFGNLAPAFKGLGFAMLASTCLVVLYYNVILAWTLFYMFAGMQSELPWSTCDSEPGYCKEGIITIPNNATNPNVTYAVGPAENYFNHHLLGWNKAVHDWENLGAVRWQLALCLLGAWIIVCLCLIKGVQSAGKVVYFTGSYWSS